MVAVRYVLLSSPYPRPTAANSVWAHMSAPRDDQLARPVVAQLASHWAGSTEITNM